jgi:hypothetical protein
MTTHTTDNQTPADGQHPLERGRTFRHWGGTWTLVAPDPDAADNWVAVNTDTHAMAILTVVDAVWTGQVMDDDQLAVEITTVWHALHQRWERVQARLSEKEQMIHDIRAYAIDRHLEGAFCRDGLNTALRHFDLEPYQPRYQVPVTVHATVHITADDAETARRRVRYLIDGIAYSGDSADDDDVDVSHDDTQIGDPETD